MGFTGRPKGKGKQGGKAFDWTKGKTKDKTGNNTGPAKTTAAASASAAETVVVETEAAPKASPPAKAEPEAKQGPKRPKKQPLSLISGRDDVGLYDYPVYGAAAAPEPGKLVLLMSICRVLGTFMERIAGALETARADRLQIVPFVAAIMDVCNRLNELAFSMFTHGVERGVSNPQVISHDGATVAEYQVLREQWGFTNINAGILTRCIGTSVLEGGETLYAGGLPFASQCFSLDHGVYAGQDIYVGNLPGQPGRVVPIWDLTAEFPTT